MPGGKSNFERLLDSATSSMLLEPNWVTNLELCDAIRQNDVTSKYALIAIRKRLKDSNPHVCKFALIVLETCVKNCGEGFHDELASHEFMNELRTLAQTGSAPVKEQILSMVQAWNHAFRNNTKYQPILATYNLMKMEGYNFPILNESDAMFSSDTAPSWKDGDVCHLCRVKFGTFTRQHHCRACGEVFCNSCSSKKSIIPKIGIEREVRVCDPCYEEINPEASNPSSTTRSEDDESELPAEYLNSALSKEPQTKPAMSDREAQQQEEDELQLALALSLSQEEAVKGTKKNWSAPTTASAPAPAPAASSNLYSSISSAPPATSSFTSEAYSSPYSSSMEVVSDSNKQQTSELDKYLDRSYWEKKNQEASRAPSAPVVIEQQQQPAAVQQPLVNGNDVYDFQAAGQQEEEDEGEFASDAFVNTMEKSIDMFVQHMNKAQMKGKHIALDTSVQSLFHSLSAMHPQLLQLIEDEEESKVKYEAMLNKLAVIREARETLNDMRAQHEEKMKQQELEQEMLRRMQMEQKLELMRQQKQEYLEYQRQLQIQRQMDLDNYQYEKLMQNQMAAKGQQPASLSYMNGYSAAYPARPGQQPYGIESQLQPDGLDADIVPPPPYSSLHGNKPTASSGPYSQPPTSYQDGLYQNVQLQPRQQPAPTSQGQWNHPTSTYQPTTEHQSSPYKVPTQQGYLPSQPGQAPLNQGQVAPQQGYQPQQQSQQTPQQNYPPPHSGHGVSQQGEFPPQTGQGPQPPQVHNQVHPQGQLSTQHAQMPSQQSQTHVQQGYLPPHHGQPSQQQAQLPPQQGQLPPQQGQLPPQQGQPPPQQGQLPPQQGQLPPQQGQPPPQQGQPPPRHSQPPPQQGSLPQDPKGQQHFIQAQQPQLQFQQPPGASQSATANQYPPQQQVTPQQFQQPPPGQQQQVQQQYQDPNQQNGYYQQQPQQQPPQQQYYPQPSYQQASPAIQEELSSNMKDLQLISFD